jgi:hypothetical protein
MASDPDPRPSPALVGTLDRRRAIVLGVALVAFVAVAIVKPWGGGSNAAFVAQRTPPAPASTVVGPPHTSPTRATRDVTPVVGSTTPEEAPAIHSSGVLAVPQTWPFDLDAGRLVDNTAQSDVWFEANTDTERFLVPESGARIVVGGLAALGASGCAAALARPYPDDAGPFFMKSTRLPTGTIPVPALTSQSHLCVRTDEGRIAEFWFDAPIALLGKTIVIRYETWDEPAPTAAPQATASLAPTRAPTRSLVRALR